MDIGVRTTCRTTGLGTKLQHFFFTGKVILPAMNHCIIRYCNYALRQVNCNLATGLVSKQHNVRTYVIIPCCVYTPIRSCTVGCMDRVMHSSMQAQRQIRSRSVLVTYLARSDRPWIKFQWYKHMHVYVFL